VKVLVFGASGGTGRQVVAQAAAQGHKVTAFVRTPSLDTRSSEADSVQGDVRDPSAVTRAVAGQNAVICCLGSATPVRRDPALVAGITHIVGAMERLSVRRLVYLSFLGVRDGRSQLSLIGRLLVAPLLLRNVVADHAAKEEIIRKSQLDWIIVRPPRLTNGPRRGSYRHGLDILAESTIPTISRADLAEFLLRQVGDDAYLHRAPAVMY
jgi:putative NADH-flavin reductase